MRRIHELRNMLQKALAVLTKLTQDKAAVATNPPAEMRLIKQLKADNT
jgi:hypothetical protein